MTHGIAAPGYRLPAETHVGTVRLQVGDLDRSIEFYEGLLGFNLIDQTTDGALLGPHDSSVALIDLRSGANASSNGRRLGLYHFAILLPDRPALGRMLNHLLESGIEPGASDHLVSEALYIKDPDGLGIEIYRDRPRSEWKAQGTEIIMATAPLDAASVLEAGADGRWDVMPPETTMGHVHLHVADLAKAKDFYHVGLGLDLMVASYQGALFLAAGGYHHHLGLNTWLGPLAKAPEPDEPRLMDWSLVLPSSQAVEAAVRSLSARGHSVQADGIGGYLAADPWGTMMRLESQE